MEYEYKRRGNETGIYIACDDRTLLETINAMLGRKGMIGVSDAEGKFHYVVDGRRSSRKAASRIIEIVTASASLIEDEIPDIQVTSLLKNTMVFYDFDMTLIGTSAIFEIVRRMIIYRDMYFSSMRELYSFAGELLGLTYYQVERDIRYAVKRSNFDRAGVKTTMVLRMLADEVTLQLKEIKRQPVNRLPS